jgi:hypothetical protein
VTIDAHTFSSLIPLGHRIVAWVMAASLPFYKPFPFSAGGTLTLGGPSGLILPLRDPAVPDVARRRSSRR